MRSGPRWPGAAAWTESNEPAHPPSRPDDPVPRDGDRARGGVPRSAAAGVHGQPGDQRRHHHRVRPGCHLRLPPGRNAQQRDRLDGDVPAEAAGHFGTDAAAPAGDHRQRLFRARRAGASGGDIDAVRLTASAEGKPIASTIIRANRKATLAIPNAHLWSPDDPHLYDLKAELVTIADPYAGEAERDRKAYDSRFTDHESQIGRAHV